MAIAAVVVLPLGLLFLLSGLVVNFIQAAFFVLFRPFSQSLYRRINGVVIELLWLQIVWLFDWWANMKILGLCLGVHPYSEVEDLAKEVETVVFFLSSNHGILFIQVELYMDSEAFQLVGNEHALLIPNHRSDIDWLVGWVLAERAGCLGSAVAIMKKSSKYLPILGWSMWFSDYVFLERNWAKDEETLKSGFQHLKNFPQPLWLALFVEGTRFTQEKLLAAQEYAAFAGLPVPRHVLVPRTKGFVSAVNHLRSFVPAIYDITVAIPKNQPQPTMLRIFRGQSSVIQVHVKRHLMEELPETSSDIADWCRNMFVAKDALLEQHLIKGTFADKECQETTRQKKSLFVVISWLCLLLYGSYNFFEWLSVLPSWEVLTLCITFLTIAMIIMHILIAFSQSEHSTPPKVSSKDPLKENLLQN